MSEGTKQAIATAECYLANAVAILYAHCGEKATIAIAQQLIEDYTKSEVIRVNVFVAQNTMVH